MYWEISAVAKMFNTIFFHLINFVKFAIFRFSGFLVDFISPCLTSGFTSASAIIIIVAQLKHLLGIKLHSHDTFSVIIELGKNIKDIRWQDTLLGVTCIIFLFCFKVRLSFVYLKKSNPKLLIFAGTSFSKYSISILSFLLGL